MRLPRHPGAIAPDDPVLFGGIRICDPQLDGYREVKHWLMNTPCCVDCAGTAIEPTTLGYEEAIVRVLLIDLERVVSLSAPDEVDVRVPDCSSAAAGYRPVRVDQQLWAATEPDAYGIGRWIRVRGLLESDLPKKLHEHIKLLIEQSPDRPDWYGRRVRLRRVNGNFC